MRAEFGAHGSTLLADLALSSLNGLTPDEALRAGAAPRDVWVALCAASDVPVSRRYGVGRQDPPAR